MGFDLQVGSHGIKSPFPNGKGWSQAQRKDRMPEIEIRFDLRDRDDGRIVLDAASCPKRFGSKMTLQFMDNSTEAKLLANPDGFNLWEKGKAFKVTTKGKNDDFGVEVDGWTLIDCGFQITSVFTSYRDLVEFDKE